MAVTLTTTARNAACDAIVDLCDLGTTDPNGDLVIRSGADAEVAILALSDPAFGDAATGTATANAISDDTNATGGTADDFILQDRDNTEVLEGSVTATGGGGDLELSSVTISGGDTVSVSSLTVTVPAS